MVAIDGTRYPLKKVNDKKYEIIQGPRANIDGCASRLLMMDFTNKDGWTFKVQFDDFASSDKLSWKEILQGIENYGDLEEQVEIRLEVAVQDIMVHLRASEIRPLTEESLPKLKEDQDFVNKPVTLDRNSGSPSHWRNFALMLKEAGYKRSDPIFDEVVALAAWLATTKQLDEFVIMPIILGEEETTLEPEYGSPTFSLINEYIAQCEKRPDHVKFGGGANRRYRQMDCPTETQIQTSLVAVRKARVLAGSIQSGEEAEEEKEIVAAYHYSVLLDILRGMHGCRDFKSTHAIETLVMCELGIPPEELEEARSGQGRGRRKRRRQKVSAKAGKKEGEVLEELFGPVDPMLYRIGCHAQISCSVKPKEKAMEFKVDGHLFLTKLLDNLVDAKVYDVPRKLSISEGVICEATRGTLPNEECRLGRCVHQILPTGVKLVGKITRATAEEDPELTCSGGEKDKDDKIVEAARSRAGIEMSKWRKNDEEFLVFKMHARRMVIQALRSVQEADHAREILLSYVRLIHWRCSVVSTALMDSEQEVVRISKSTNASALLDVLEKQAPGNDADPKKKEKEEEAASKKFLHFQEATTKAGLHIREVVELTRTDVHFLRNAMLMVIAIDAFPEAQRRKMMSSTSKEEIKGLIKDSKLPGVRSWEKAEKELTLHVGSATKRKKKGDGGIHVYTQNELARQAATYLLVAPRFLASANSVEQLMCSSLSAIKKCTGPNIVDDAILEPAKKRLSQKLPTLVAKDGDTIVVGWQGNKESPEDHVRALAKYLPTS